MKFIDTPTAPALDRRASSVRPRQAGQSMTEYLIATLFVGIILFTGEPSVLQRLLDGIQASYSRFTYLISMP